MTSLLRGIRSIFRLTTPTSDLDPTAVGRSTIRAELPQNLKRGVSRTSSSEGAFTPASVSFDAKQVPSAVSDTAPPGYRAQLLHCGSSGVAKLVGRSRDREPGQTWSGIDFQSFSSVAT